MSKSTTKKETPEIRINIRVPQAEKDQLTAVSKQLGIPATFIVREALKEKIRRINKDLQENVASAVTVL